MSINELEKIANTCKNEDDCYCCTCKKECKEIGGNPQEKLRLMKG